jgi:hypothetical protein
MKVMGLPLNEEKRSRKDTEFKHVHAVQTVAHLLFKDDGATTQNLDVR